MSERNTNEELEKDLTELMAKHNGRGASRMLARYVMANLAALERVLKGADAGEAETMWAIGFNEPGDYWFGPVESVDKCLAAYALRGSKIYVLEGGKATVRYEAKDGKWEVAF